MYTADGTRKLEFDQIVNKEKSQSAAFSPGAFPSFEGLEYFGNNFFIDTFAAVPVNDKRFLFGIDDFYRDSVPHSFSFSVEAMMERIPDQTVQGFLQGTYRSHHESVCSRKIKGTLHIRPLQDS